MQKNDAIEQILSDLDIMEKALQKSSSDKLQELIVVYLLTNCGFIEYCLNTVYSQTTKEQRGSYGRQDPRTDSSAIEDSFREIAIIAIDKAKRYWKSYLQRSLSDDNLHMLRRGLIVATHHISSDLKPRTIFFHPIREYMQNLNS